jgi:AmpE protein
MSLLSILFSLAIERYFEPVSQLRNFRWIITFSNWIKERFSKSEFWNDTLGLIVIILLPMFVCAIIYSQLHNALALLGFLFSLGVLVYCMGPTRTHHIARLYLDAGEHEDEHSLKTYATELLGVNISDNKQENHQLVCEKIIVSTNESLLGVFFWFVLLGPMGALMFRMVSVLYEEFQQHSDADDETSTSGYTEFNNSTRMLYAILIWLPAQLTTLAFAITGSFIDTLHEWKSRLSKDYLNPIESEQTLFRAGMSALQMNPDSHQFELGTVQEILALCWRSIIVWVTALALLTLAGWTG